MRLLASTDLGVKILLYMAACSKERVTIAEMNQYFQVKPSAYKAPLKSLIDGEIISSTTGRGGGYALKRDPTKLMLGEVVAVLEGDLRLIPWLETEENGALLYPNSVYRFAIEHGKTALLKQLDHFAIAEIAADPYTQTALNITHLTKKGRS